LSQRANPTKILPSIMPRPPKLVDWQLIHSLAIKGVPLAQIARQFEISYATVITRSKREHWNVAARPWRTGMLPNSELDHKANAELAEATRLLAKLSAQTRINAATVLHKFFASYTHCSIKKIKEDSSAIAKMLSSAHQVFGWNVPKSAESSKPQDLHLQILNMPGTSTPSGSAPELVSQAEQKRIQDSLSSEANDISPMGSTVAEDSE
jgi:hypothetical protein